MRMGISPAIPQARHDRGRLGGLDGAFDDLSLRISRAVLEIRQ
jgi:hypothetical protein